MPKGRKSRLDRFENRARDFAIGLNRNWTTRDNRRIQVGVGPHKRMTTKRVPEQVIRANRLYEKLKQFLELNAIIPEHYQLESVAYNEEFNVQEYFERPTISELNHFFSKQQNNLTTEESLICKRMVKRFEQITKTKVAESFREITTHFNMLDSFMVKSNLLVLGITRDGKLRLAIIDI